MDDKVGNLKLLSADLDLSAARLQEIIDSLPYTIFVCRFAPGDSTPAYSFVSANVNRILGVDADAVLRGREMPFRNVLPEDRSSVNEHICEAFAHGGEWRHEFRVRVGAAVHWVECRACVSKLPDGGAAAHGCWVDVSERKAHEIEYHGTYERFRRMFESAPQAIGISDSTGKVKSVNPQYTKIFGFTLDEIPTLADAFKNHFPDPAYRMRIMEEWNAATEESARTGAPARVVVARMRCKNGTERIVEARTAAVGDERIVILNDVTERVEAEIERARAEERMRLWTSVLDHSSEGILVCDAERRILLVNAAFRELTGYSEEDVIGQTPRILQSGRQDASFYAAMWKALNETGQWRGEIWNRRKSGEFYAEWLSISAVRDERGMVTHYVGVFSDITRHKESEERIRHLAQYDALTDLPNRMLFNDRLDQLIKAAERDGSKIGVLYVDLDRFNDVNDSLGHEAGDQLLVTMSKRMSEAVRHADTIARMGGDEFVVVLSRLHHPEDAAAVAQKLLNVITQPLLLGGNEIATSASIGICIFPDDGIDAGDLVRNADAAMYRAKAAGRSVYRFYTRDMNERALERLSTENALRRAIENREFVLHYQPQIDLASGAIVATEALIRWNRPGVGLVPPGEFIPIAEERGLITQIGRWTIEEAARQAVAWDAAGITIPVAVNLSAVQFHQRRFVEYIAAMLREYRLKPECFELELTERIIIHDAEATVAVFERLHRLGVGLSIDDFGTGYSSLNYLRRFPIDMIKIDKSFVGEITEHSDTTRIIISIIALAKGLGLKVLAEGVETEAQRTFLCEHGCDRAQGFLFSRALPSEAFEKLFRRWPDRG